jgi:putative nucleotidyltransferase with HDIG domain
MPRVVPRVTGRGAPDRCFDRFRQGRSLRKRIPVTDVRVGVFVDELCASWVDHPFWRGSFLVADEEQLQRLRESAVREVWIDTDKGLDPAPAGPAPGPADTPVPAAQAAAAAGPAAATTLAEEFARAARIFEESRTVVVDLFSQARMGSIQDTEKAKSVVDVIADSVERHPMAMLGLARLKSADDYTFLHSISVSALMVTLARKIGTAETDARQAGMAGLLHDVGKAQIPLAILNKPGALDEQEWAVMRTHAERGHAILKGTPDVAPEVLDAVLHHHEKLDGSGYPHGLKGQQISPLARMCALCDVYDAITSNRPYKSGWHPTMAVRRMREWVGSHFDAELFNAFVKAVGIYPIGSLVRLKSHRLAVVVEHNSAQLLQPTVKAFFSLRLKMHVEPVLIDLGARHASDAIVGYEDPEVHGLTRLDEIWLPPDAKRG